MASADSYDVIVIGAGPAGYVAAIRCAQLGMQVACIERRGVAAGGEAAVLGGTCLNVGCIPSKALLDSSQRFLDASSESLASHGVRTAEVSLDLSAMMARKEQVVQQLTRGISGLFKGNKVVPLAGEATLLSGRAVELRVPNAEPRRLQAKHVILATGSEPMALPSAPFDAERIVDSTGGLSFGEVPARLGVIGAGAIGLELGSVWSRLGAEVVIIEALSDFLPAVDRPVAREAAKLFAAQGLDIRLGSRLESARVDADGVVISYTDAQGEQHSERFDRLIVAVGRQPCSDGLLAPDAGVTIDESGRIPVDAHCATALDGVWAVGDLVRGPMLAHKGAEEGVMVAERIAGKPATLNYDTIPGVVYTHPEVAWVGRHEEQLQAAGIPCRVGAFSFAANGRALAAGEAKGLVRIIADAETDRIYGCHIVGPGAADLVQQLVIAMEFGASAEDLALIVTAHPTVSEAVHEAALAVDQRALHALNRRR